MSIKKLLATAIEKHKSAEYEKAIKLYTKILSAESGHLDANYLLGTLYIEYGDYKKAQMYLTKAIRINPNSPYINVNLGHLYRKLGSHDLAVNYFSHACQLMPSLCEAHLGLGTALLELGVDLDKAADCFKRALFLAPNVPEAYHQLAVLSGLKGNTDEAFELFEKARSLNPQLPGIHFDIGKMYLTAGLAEKAAEHLTEACRVSPGDVKAAYFLAIAEGRTPDDDLVHKYSESLFDGFSATFEKRLVDRLGYSLPFKIVETLSQIPRDNVRFDSVIDLGCGTGLSGEALRGSAIQLTGIDISEKMVEIARAKSCYDQLYCGDIVTVLSMLEGGFDLFVATDVLVYIGKLDTLLESIVSHAKPGALFLFSTEIFDGKDFSLRNNGRYAHSSAYIHEIIKVHGCTIVSEEVINLRQEAGIWAKGNLFVVQLSN
jgi:predicted TPR repeat methyltransferase